MHLPRFLAEPLLPILSAALHAAPLKTRLGGVSTVTAMALGLYSFDDLRTARLRNGMTLRVRLSDYNGRMLYLFGTPDPKVIAVCGALLRPGDVFLDIGANFGTVGLLNHQHVGANGEVHFVEPQPQLCRSIERSINDAGIPNAFVHNCGMWDSDGELSLTIPEKHTGAASISESDGGDSAVRVRVRAIDSFLSEVVGERPFCAKIDVEGAEVNILPGLLSRPGMRFALFECNVPKVRDHAWGLVRDKRLALFGLGKNLFMTRLRLIKSRAELDKIHDVLAVRMDPDEAVGTTVHPTKLAQALNQTGRPRV